MKKSITLLLIFVASLSYAQVIQGRVLQVDPLNLDKMKAAVAAKTKMYNSKKGSARFATFQILSGPQSNNLYRIQIADNIGAFDTAVNKQELDYWWKATGKLHTPLANRFWTVNKDATYVPDDFKRVKHRRVLIYKLIPGKEDDFWQYRSRLAKALKEAGWKNRVGVLNCQSGCNGSWVQVRYHHDDFSAMAKENSELFPKVVEKYDELYGEDAYANDSEKLQTSVSENIAQYQQYLPELSSPWND
ncbi:MAG: hypothetical protein ACPHSE_01830 [Flavobacteriaceae bacterium]